MTAQKTDEPITIDPLTTDIGTMPKHGAGPVPAGSRVPIGSRLQNIRVEDFSPNWMKAVTKVDQGKLKSYQTRKASAARADQGPTVADCMAEIEGLKEALRSANGKIGALSQKVDALEAASKAKPAAKPAPKPKAPAKPAGTDATKPEE